MADNDRQASTIPGVGQIDGGSAPHLMVTPWYRDATNGAVYVHRDLVQVRAPWEDAERAETHLPPQSGAQWLGDVESFAAYVRRFGQPETTLVQWNAAGLSATLDYHHSDGTPGRCKWTASHAFARSRQLERWAGFAAGQPKGQKDLIEFLEDMADTVLEPTAADLTSILSTLRAHVKSETRSTFEADGSSSLSFEKDSKLLGSTKIPPTFVVSIPVLAGHLSADGDIVQYDLDVRLRVTPTEQGVVFRLSIPALQDALEAAYTDRVAAATAALGDAYPVLRASDAAKGA